MAYCNTSKVLIDAFASMRAYQSLFFPAVFESLPLVTMGPPEPFLWRGSAAASESCSSDSDSPNKQQPLLFLPQPTLLLPIDHSSYHTTHNTQCLPHSTN